MNDVVRDIIVIPRGPSPQKSIQSQHLPVRVLELLHALVANGYHLFQKKKIETLKV